MICASEVLPSPGGPASRTWSSASPRPRAASSAIPSCSFTRSWPTNSASEPGRSERSISSSPLSWTTVAATRSRHAAFFSADRTCSSTESDSSTSASARSASTSDHPSSTSASRASSSPAGRTGGTGRFCQLVLQLHHDALRRLAADARDRLEARQVVAGDRAPQLGRRRARDDRERDLRPDPGHAEQQLEELAARPPRRSRRAGARPRGRGGTSRPSPPRPTRACTRGVAATR